MKGISLGHDPDLGRKFSEESSGLVIGLGRSSLRKSEAQVKQSWIEENGREPDSQQMHDAMVASREAPPVTPKRLPDAPTRNQFASQEEFEEARGYWQGHVGRIRAMVDRAARSKASRPE